MTYSPAVEFGLYGVVKDSSFAIVEKPFLWLLGRSWEVLRALERRQSLRRRKDG